MVADFLWRGFCDKISDSQILSIAHIQWQKSNIKWQMGFVNNYRFCCSERRGGVDGKPIESLCFDLSPWSWVDG
jgi:hypothetical protein